MAFHLKVTNCVDRILLFNDELVGEMTCVDTESTSEKIFNGTIDKPTDAVLLCYVLGESVLDARDVFSRPLQSRPDDANNDVMGNAICVNYFKPKTDEEVATPQICVVDISERLQLGIGISPTIILQKASFNKDNVTPEELSKYGFDAKADGYFIKPISHLWPKTDLEDEKITISLYAHSIIKHLDV